MQKWWILPTRIQALSVVTSRATVFAYFLLHVGVQDTNLGNLRIFFQCFAKAGQIENLDSGEK